MYDHLFLEQGNERRKQLTVQTVLVKVIRRAVRCRHHNNTARKQCLEQTPDQHRIGNVRYLHLVKSQEPHLVGQLCRNGRERVINTGFANLRHLGVNPLHERMKMAALFGGIDLIVQQVHQHRFAAPDTSPHIQAADRLWRLSEETTFHRLRQSCTHTFQLWQNGKLRVVGV